jgi:hypothetical protein
METADILNVLGVGLLVTAPSFLVWVAALVFSIIVFRRYRGKAERFLIVGSILIMLSSLVLIPSNLILSIALARHSQEIEAMKTLSNLFIWLRKTLTMAGMICFIWAFWVKFNMKDSAPAGITGPEKPVSPAQ